MPSSLTWLNYSDEERQQALNVVRMFRARDTVDELGIGAIRDSIADQLFPGTTTIQTRARYFLFVPWVYRVIERKRQRPEDAAFEARRAEVALINALLESDETDGVIGVSARDKLKRLPSGIYWQGLATWGIRTFAGSKEDYHRLLESNFDFSAGRDRYEGGDRPVRPSAWDKSLPDPPERFPSGVTLDLTKEEADYLAWRISSDARPRPNLLEFLVDRGQPTDGVEFPWEHPQLGEFPDAIRQLLEHGRLFSQVMHGAALLYNLLLAEAKRSDELIERYKESYSDWAIAFAQELPIVRAWDRDRFWELAGQGSHKVTHQARRFVNSWLELLDRETPDSLSGNQKTRDLVRRRERELKLGQARLANPRALDIWGGA